MIDSDDPTNKYFLEKQQDKNGKKESKKNVAAPPAVPEDQKLNERSSGNKEKEVQTKFEYPSDTPVSENYKLDAQLKKLELQKAENDIALQNAKIQKLSGEQIPTQLVRGLIAQHSKSITVAFKNAAEVFLTRIVQKAGIDRTIATDLKADLIGIVNQAVNDSIEESKKSIENIVSEYSQKREVGERT